jgi:putative transposase
MGRKRRAEFPGAAYHLTARGNNRQDIFLDDHYRHAFPDRPAQAVDRYDLKVHLNCLMTNRCHLLLSASEAKHPGAICPLNTPSPQEVKRVPQKFNPCITLTPNHGRFQRRLMLNVKT